MSKKHIAPPKDFAFVPDTFSLRGEVATVGEPPSVKAKDTTGELFAKTETGVSPSQRYALPDDGLIRN